MVPSRVLSALALAALLVLSGHTVLVGGVAIESGKAYYITLAKRPQCAEKAQFLGFNNNACASHNTVTLSPKVDAAWARWVVDVKEAVAGGTYIVQIFAHWDLTEPPAPKCQGKLAVSKPRLCKAGPGLTKVELSATSPQKWILRPAGSNTYQILANVRRSGCFRFLGAAGKCGGALKPALFKADNGLQRWIVGEIPDQQGAAQPAGQPIITSSTTTSSAWIVMWDDGSAGEPQESYALKCTGAGSTSCFDPPVGPVVENIPRGAGAGTLEGLPADTHLHCYAVALNSDGASCSLPQPILTMPVPTDAFKPGAPTITDSAIIGSVWKVKWADGAAGDPVEVYSALCVNFGDGCSAVATGNSVYGVKRGVQNADVSGLPTGKYSCYVRSENVVGISCSSPQTVEVPINPNNALPGKPTSLIDVISGDTWLVTWKDGAAGTPTETYSAYCAHRGEGCNDRHQGFPETGIVRGVQRGRVFGLPSSLPLDCFVIAENIEGRVCSDPVPVEIRRNSPPLNVESPPGQPWGVSTLAVTTTTWTALWYDGDVGFPQETYTVLCTLPGAGCRGPVAGMTSNIPRGAGSGTVQGLQLGTTYTCYVVAINRSGSICSVGLTITTSNTGPLPAAPGKPQALQSVNVGATFWTARWVDGAMGSPVERYELICYPYGAPCDPRTQRRRLVHQTAVPSRWLNQTSVTNRRLHQISVPSPLPPSPPSRPVAITANIPRGAQSASVVNLPSSSAYTCYVKAINAVSGVCSDGVTVFTALAPYRMPGRPTQLRTVIVTETSWTAAWVEGFIGVPTETYKLVCVYQDSPCNAVPVAVTDGIPRGTRTATVVGLRASTYYSCYAVAYNSVGSVCSLAFDFSTRPGLPAGKPTITSSTVTGTTWQVNWTDGSLGRPEEYYYGICKPPGGVCGEVPGFVAGRTNNMPRGTQAAILPNLSPGTFTCWIVAANTAGETCSSAVIVVATT